MAGGLDEEAKQDCIDKGDHILYDDECIDFDNAILLLNLLPDFWDLVEEYKLIGKIHHCTSWAKIRKKYNLEKLHGLHSKQRRVRSIKMSKTGSIFNYFYFFHPQVRSSDKLISYRLKCPV